MSFATGIITISFAQNNEAPSTKTNSDSIPKPRYTLYSNTPQSDPTPAALERAPDAIDSVQSPEVKTPVIKPVLTESSVVDSAVIESNVTEPGVSKQHFTESGLPISESGKPVSPETPVQEIKSTETERITPTSGISESGLPVTPQKPPQEIKSNISDPIIIEPSTSSQPESERPVSTERFVAPERKNNQANISPDGTIHDWSNPPDFTGYVQHKDVKMEKHKMKTKKHKYRPHHKYQHKKKHIKSPKF